MNAIQDKCRPKHQVLVLKCYPRTTKGAVDVRPNSSELSYLLFYATSRRSKIQKIGAFLEKKTASDVWRMRIGNVQVTLGILAALVEKSPKDAALISPVVLKILEMVLHSDDITMIESSLPTFAAFCENHDQSSLFADQTYLQQYQAVVTAYANLASTRPLTTANPDNRPRHNRRRSAGLQAIRSVVTSDPLASVPGRQLDVIVPKILENLWTDDDDALEALHYSLQGAEKEDGPPITRRRTSISTVRTAETADANPMSFSGTAMDADKVAEDQIGVDALQCLRSIYIVPNRPQIYAATNALVKFIFERIHEGQSVIGSRRGSGWGPKIYNFTAGWAPVQDRYVILVTVLDSLLRTRFAEDTLPQHTALATMMSSLLQSDINLIGLSVMDVLLGLIKQMKRLFRLQSDGSPSASVTEKAVVDNENSLPNRRELLSQLEECAADLATHVYYTDQIPDMISTILARLKPSRASSTNSISQGDKPEGVNGGPDGSLADLNESQSNSDAYFAHHAGRLSALRVIRQILLVANPKTKVTGNMDLSRNRVPVSVWEGSHWLLRDPDGPVRKAYAQALMIWLDRETTRADFRAVDDQAAKSRSSTKHSREFPMTSSARLAASQASIRDGTARGRKSQFLPLLHLSIYDNALQYVDSDNDIVMLHVLLTKLTFKLGVNAARYGVPMVYRLQEDIQDLDTPIHKVRIASLCHGYFWALTEKFDFETSTIGRAIQNEVSRRRSKGFWVEGISVPAPSLDQIGTPGLPGQSPSWDHAELEKEEILPFDDRSTLVECISTGYTESCLSPPQSPVASPGRNMANPMHMSTVSSTFANHGDPDSELPSRFRDQMLTDFSREAVIALLSAEGKAESLNASKSGTSVTRQKLTVNTAAFHNHINGHNQLPSPFGSQRDNTRPRSARVPGEADQLGAFRKSRQNSVRSAVSPTTRTNGTRSSKAGITSVEQLKMVLSGNVSATAFPRSRGAVNNDDDGDSDDSMVSYEEDEPSEVSFHHHQHHHRTSPPPPGSRHNNEPTTLTTTSTNNTAESFHGHDNDGHQVPPVPPIPNKHSFSNNHPSSAAAHPDSNGGNTSNIAKHDYADTLAHGSGSPHRRNLYSRAGHAGDGGARTAPMDLQDLLRGIDSSGGEGSLGNLTKPPY